MYIVHKPVKRDNKEQYNTRDNSFFQRKMSCSGGIRTHDTLLSRQVFGHVHVHVHVTGTQKYVHVINVRLNCCKPLLSLPHFQSVCQYDVDPSPVEGVHVHVHVHTCTCNTTTHFTSECYSEVLQYVKWESHLHVYA